MTEAQVEPVSELYGKPKEISYLEDHSTTTLQTALDVLHKNKYNVEAANRVSIRSNYRSLVQEMKREGVFWCLQKPYLKEHWSSVEVAMFEVKFV